MSVAETDGEALSRPGPMPVLVLRSSIATVQSVTTAFAEEAIRIRDTGHLSNRDIARATGAGSTVGAWLRRTGSPRGERAERLVERLIIVAVVIAQRARAGPAAASGERNGRDGDDVEPLEDRITPRAEVGLGRIVRRRHRAQREGELVLRVRLFRDAKNPKRPSLTFGPARRMWNLLTRGKRFP
jgi:hypothetical protein